MADARRVYLEIQAELGGGEVVLPAGLTPEGRRGVEAEGRRDGTAHGSSGKEVTHNDASPAGATPSASPPLRPSARPAADWRKNLPPVPGPGLVVNPPARQLLDASPDYGSLEAVAEAVRSCRKCFLAQGRTHTVPGEGNAAARLMCVGEGPGETEDRTGRPFVGKAGELLDDILAAIGMPRETVFIANVVKCRPPQNRKPLPDEAEACLPFLRAQIALIRPAVLLALGATAAEALLGARKSLGELRGKVHRYDGIPLIVTYHPAALLRNPNWKKPTWDDVRIARQLVDA